MGGIGTRADVERAPGQGAKGSEPARFTRKRKVENHQSKEGEERREGGKVGGLARAIGMDLSLN